MQSVSTMVEAQKYFGDQVRSLEIWTPRNLKLDTHVTGTAVMKMGACV